MANVYNISKIVIVQANNSINIIFNFYLILNTSITYFIK